MLHLIEDLCIFKIFLCFARCHLILKVDWNQLIDYVMLIFSTYVDFVFFCRYMLILVNFVNVVSTDTLVYPISYDHLIIFKNCFLNSYITEIPDMWVLSRFWPKTTIIWFILAFCSLVFFCIKIGHIPTI